MRRLAILLLLLSGCGPLAKEPAAADELDAGAPSLGEFSAAQLHESLNAKDFLMIDVHVPRAGVVPGTDASITWTDIDGLVASIGPSLARKVVLTCLSGHMSEQAGHALIARGYSAVSELTGGMSAWVAAGYTLDP